MKKRENFVVLGKIGELALIHIRLSVVKLIPPLLIAVLPALANAQSNYYTENNKTVVVVGAQGSSGYVNFASTTANWLYGNVYFDLTTDAGKADLSLILTAKATNRPLTRVDYTLGSNGMCTATLIQL